MEIALQILLGIVTLICFLGGMNLLIKGSNAFLPNTISNIPVLDNLFRFLSGIYFGLGFLLSWVDFHFHSINDLLYFIGLVVIFSGLGRLYSRIKVGPAGKYFDFTMYLEFFLGTGIILLQYFR